MNVLQPVNLIGIPEPGQLVEVRRRQWVVADIVASGPINSGYPHQHMVTLASIDNAMILK